MQNINILVLYIYVRCKVICDVVKKSNLTHICVFQGHKFRVYALATVHI